MVSRELPLEDFAAPGSFSPPSRSVFVFGGMYALISIDSTLGEPRMNHFRVLRGGDQLLRETWVHTVLVCVGLNPFSSS